MSVIEKRKLSNLHVKSIEEEILLIREAEEDYSANWWMDARESYIKGLEFINNLWK